MPNERGLGIGGGLIGGAIGQGLGLIFGGVQDERQRKQAKDLADIQAEKNKELAKYNQELAMKMWNDTNYDAQKKKMEEAGLNVGLMYGGTGSGGSTQGAGQAGAVSGQAADGGVARTGMGMQIAAQLALMGAQKENIEADTENKKAITGKTGIETEQGKINLDTSKETQGDIIAKIGSEAEEAMAKAKQAVTNSIINEETYKDQIQKIKLEAVGEGLENELKKAGIQKSYTEIKKILNDIKIGNTGIEYQGTDKIMGKYIEAIGKALGSIITGQ